MKYRKVGRYDYELQKPVWSKGRPTAHNTIERATIARSGGVLTKDRCGGELVVLKVDEGFVLCSCTKCGQMQYWERSL